MDEDWEPSKKRCSLGNPGTLVRKEILLPFFHSRDVGFAFTRGSLTRGTSMPSVRGAGKIFHCSPKISAKICAGGRGGEANCMILLGREILVAGLCPPLPVAHTHTHTHTHTHKQKLRYSANTYTDVNRTKNVKSRSVVMYNCPDVVSFELARNLVEESDTSPVKPGLSLTDRFASRLRI
jgi:hypothetical protein